MIGTSFELISVAVLWDSEASMATKGVIYMHVIADHVCNIYTCLLSGLYLAGAKIFMRVFWSFAYHLRHHASPSPPRADE